MGAISKINFSDNCIVEIRQNATSFSSFNKTRIETTGFDLNQVLFLVSHKL
jgi:hypothetical protein